MDLWEAQSFTDHLNNCYFRMILEEGNCGTKKKICLRRVLGISVDEIGEDREEAKANVKRERLTGGLDG